MMRRRDGVPARHCQLPILELARLVVLVKPPPEVCDHNLVMPQRLRLLRDALEAPLAHVDVARHRLPEHLDRQQVRDGLWADEVREQVGARRKAAEEPEGAHDHVVLVRLLVRRRLVCQLAAAVVHVACRGLGELEHAGTVAKGAAGPDPAAVVVACRLLGGHVVGGRNTKAPAEPRQRLGFWRPVLLHHRNLLDGGALLHERLLERLPRGVEGTWSRRDGRRAGQWQRGRRAGQ